MKTFNYSDDLFEIIKNQQLVEINLIGAPTYKVAYLLKISDDYLIFAEVSSSATYAGTIVCRMEDVESISKESIYLEELTKQVNGEKHSQQIEIDTTNITEASFDGFISAFENTETIVEVTYLNETTIAGRVISHDDKALVVDEYYSEYGRRLKRTYVNREVILRIAVSVPWLHTISLALTDAKI